MSTILECKGLSHKYGKKTALDDVSFTIESGKIVGLFGPNGSGKTTLIKIMTGMIYDESGAVSICDNKPGEKTKAVVSYSPASFAFRSDRRICDILDAYEIIYEDFDRGDAEKTLEELGMYSKDVVGKLSKGNCEKFQIILTMSRKAKLYILDEPFDGVDPVARENIIRIMLQKVPEESSLFISTHQISEIENILDGALFLKEGKLVFEGSIDDIRDKSGKSLVDAYMEEFR